MLNMMPAAILGPPRGHGVSPLPQARQACPGSLLREKRGRSGWRWEESFLQQQKGFLDFLPLLVPLTLA